MSGGRRYGKRTEARNPAVRSVHFSPPHGSPRFKFLGTTENVSESGFCLYTVYEIEEGTELRVKSKEMWPGPRKATVRWCEKKVEGRLYKLGLRLS